MVNDKFYANVLCKSISARADIKYYITTLSKFTFLMFTIEKKKNSKITCYTSKLDIFPTYK